MTKEPLTIASYNLSIHLAYPAQHQLIRNTDYLPDKVYEFFNLLTFLPFMMTQWTNTLSLLANSIIISSYSLNSEYEGPDKAFGKSLVIEQEG